MYKPKVYKKTLIHVRKAFRALLIVNLKLLDLLLLNTSTSDQSEAYLEPMMLKLLQI